MARTRPCFVVKEGRVTVRWVCRRPDGSVIWDFLDSYLLVPDQGRWRILGDVVHA